MGSEEIQLMQRLLIEANGKHGGDLAILKSGALWRISFATPPDKEAVASMPQGRTFAEAAKAALSSLTDRN